MAFNTSSCKIFQQAGLSALNKRGVLKRNASASQEEEEDLDYVSEKEAMETRFQIHVRRELEL